MHTMSVVGVHMFFSRKKEKEREQTEKIRITFFPTNEEYRNREREIERNNHFV
jgi:hypothetical protein